MFDCLHDMGDPVGAARHVHDLLAPDGTWMIVEPQAGDRIEDNLNPVGRAYYGFSTLLCTPASLSQEVGMALGAQAGEARIRDVVTAGGLTRFRRAAETPFNNVFEARRVSARRVRLGSPDGPDGRPRHALGCRTRADTWSATASASGGMPTGPGTAPCSCCRPGRSCTRGCGRRRSTTSPVTSGS